MSGTGGSKYTTQANGWFMQSVANNNNNGGSKHGSGSYPASQQNSGSYPSSTSKYSKTAPRPIFSVSGDSSQQQQQQQQQLVPRPAVHQSLQQQQQNPPPSLSRAIPTAATAAAASSSTSTTAPPKKFSFRRPTNTTNNTGGAPASTASAASINSSSALPSSSVQHFHQQQQQQQQQQQPRGFSTAAVVQRNTSAITHIQQQQQQQQQSQQYPPPPPPPQQQQQHKLQLKKNPTRTWWPHMFAEAVGLVVETPNPATTKAHRMQTARLRQEFSALVDSLKTRQRTALLRQKSLDEYARALKDVSNDAGAKKALDLWEALEATSNEINGKLRDIRNKMQQQQDSLASAAAAAATPATASTAPTPTPGRFSFNSLQRRRAKVPQLGSEITPEGAVALLEASGEFQGKLMPFQERSLAFFLNLACRGAHGILADEPGLGKTVSSIALIIGMRQLLRQQQQQQANEHNIKAEDDVLFGGSNGGTRGGRGGRGSRGRGRGATAAAATPPPLPPSIVVAPLSTAATWQREFETFAPSLRVAVIGAVENDARAALFKEFFRENLPAAAGRTAAPKKAAGRRRNRHSPSSSSSSPSSSEEEDDDDDDDDETSSSDDETTSSGDIGDDSDSSAPRRGRGRGRGGRGGRGGAAAATAGGGVKAATAAQLARLGYGHDVIVIPHHFFSNMKMALVRAYLTKLTKAPWLYCIVDEAHRIKNEQAILTQTLQKFENVTHRLVLTGTPLQNSLGELWTLLSFLLPDVFSRKQFADLFDVIADIHQVPDCDDDDDADDDDDDSDADLDKDGAKKKKKSKKNKTGATSAAASAAIKKKNTDMQRERARASAEERQFLLCRKIHDVLLPLMVRREKREVIEALPQVTEWVVMCPWAALQRYEEGRIQKNRREIERVGKSNADCGDIDAMFRRQRGPKPAESSSTSEEDDDDVVPVKKSGKKKTSPDDDDDEVSSDSTIDDSSAALDQFVERRISSHPFLLLRPSVMNKLLYDEAVQHVLHRGSGKMVILDLFLRFIDNYNTMMMTAASTASTDSSKKPPTSNNFRPHKVLIFSQWTQLLDLVETHVGWGRNWPVQRLDGSTSGRTELLENFRTDDSQFVFLLSKGAGGVGLNLQSADTVVLLDVDYNPTQDSQAIARAYRVGQDRDVLVLRLMAESETEMGILNIARRKQALESRVIRAAKADMETEEAERDQALRRVVFKNNNNNNMNHDDDDGDKDVGVVVPPEDRDTTLSVPALAGGMCDNAAFSQFNFSSLSSSTTPSEYQKKIRLAIAEQVIRFFPRNESERSHLQHLISDTDFLDEAVEALMPSPDPNPPQCLRIPQTRDNYKNNVFRAVPNLMVHEDLGQRQAAKDAEERYAGMTMSDFSEDDDNYD